ncbi:Eukaryotic translation initiation factor 3 subunit C [Dichanthelium oligosanthes]|uniref:Eukaryotic translation initiation factor 3 subunit C n=1 Tax=Dichanthelium oligosanthes TaxID=888268 RepID=A0A1E5W8F5_9POAL|nr:Eukaryotic translation initiation factor 3 subunit C [Dichanthelium oligosanthes]
MNSSNATKLNSMKENLKKNNKQYAELILKCRQNSECFYKEDANDKGKDDSDDEYDSDQNVDTNRLASDEREDNNHGDSQNEEPWKKIDNKDNPMHKQFSKDPSEITWEIVDKKLKEIVASRGKKAQFDINPSLLGHMPISVWKSCANNILRMLDILQQYPNIAIDNVVEPAEKETCNGADYDGTIHVSGDLAASLRDWTRVFQEFAVR